MYIGEQIINPTEDRLRLSVQLGAEHVVLDTRPNTQIEGTDGYWDGAKVAAYRQWVEAQGLHLECLALDTGSFLADTKFNPDRARARADKLRADIEAAARGGMEMLKFNLQFVGITRSGRRVGRGGVRESTFCTAEYDPQKDARYSYWGAGHIGSGTGADAGVNPVGEAEALGQVVATDLGTVSEAEAWEAMTQLVEAVVPTAERLGIRLASHPQDPAYPKGGLNGVEHVVGSIEGMERYLSLAASEVHGLNFCIGTVAEMAPDPSPYVMDAIRRCAGRIFMVHFRNIKGGYCDFSECFPDEGAVDMAEAIRTFRETGYGGILCPDHVPASDLDPDRERFFAFALGYTKGLLHAA